MSPFWKATLEAAGWTALEVFIVTLAAGWSGVGLGDWAGLGDLAMAAVLSAAAAGISFIKSLLVRRWGQTDSPLLTEMPCE